MMNTLKKNLIVHSIVFVLFMNIGAVVAQASFPGKIIAQSPDPVTMFLASPSIVILPDGTYIASHDSGGENANGVFSAIYKSGDKGDTWELTTVLKDIRWANLFYHNDALYIMGVKNGMGDVHIRRSTDKGNTWTLPSDANNGVLLKGYFHTGPTPTVVHNGRVWRAFEESYDLKDKRKFNAFVMSVPAHSDLLKASNWTRTNNVKFNDDWVNADSPEWCEGNVVVTPDGKIVDFLRMKTDQPVNGTLEMQGYAAGIPRYEVAAMINISDDGTTATFDPATNFVHFPGASTKFTIRYDSVSKKYWSIINKITTVKSGWGNGSSDGPWNQRNVVILSSSTDLKNWEERYKMLRWNEGDIITRRTTFGFQYVDWQFEGNDIVAVMRTSWYGQDWHNANLLTFHRLADFRNLKMEDSPADIGHLTKAPPAILFWEFSTANGNESSSNASYIHPDLKVSVLRRGEGMLPAKFERSFSSMPSTAHNSLKTAIEQKHFYEFTVQPKEGTLVSVSTIDARLSRKSLGPRSYIWMYSKNGGEFQPIGSGTVFNMVMEEAGTVQATINLESYKALHDLSSKDFATFRIYVFGSAKEKGQISFGRNGNGDTTPSLAIGGIVKVEKDHVPLLAWNFSNYYSNDDHVKADINDNNIRTSYLSRGGGFTAAGLKGAYNSNMRVDGTKQDALIEDAYYVFNVQVKKGKKLSLSGLEAKLRRTGTGPIYYRWYYKINNGPLTPVENSDVLFLSKITADYVQPIINLSSRAALQSLGDRDNVSFRLYAWGATSAVGGFAIGQFTGQNCLSLYGVLK